MSDTRWFALETDDGPTRLRLSGAWRLRHLVEIEGALAGLRLPATATVDGSALAEIDSAAALVLLRALQGGPAGAGGLSWVGFSEADGRIVEQVRAHLEASAAPPPQRGLRPLATLGRSALELAALLGGHVNFLGATIVAFGEALLQPRRLRLRELTVQLEQTGLMAIPVVALVTMLIGVVITYLLGLQAEKYGANIFVVDGVGIGATREFAPIIVAVIVAGRSGAAFTAQLGSMRLTEETDAIRTLGLSPMQVLVVPRVLALMIVLPLLVFVGDVASLLGSMAIAGPMLDIAPNAFLARLREALDIRHVFVGLAKAPVFALVIAVIGSRMGMTVGRDTRALGAATTSTVVQSIVAVILLDAVFAVLMQALDLSVLDAAPVIEVDAIVTRFGEQTVHDGVSFAVGRGTLVGLIGASGTGKSVLLREIIGLQRPTAGRASLFGVDIWSAEPDELDAVRRRFGMMFQDGALFSSLSVAQNVAVPLREHTRLAHATVDALVALRLQQAGLPADAGAKMPSELSGGMRKRAAIARAIALEPEVLFLDEPTSGLDPITARGFDRLVRSLVDDLGLTVFLVTHDLDTLLGVVDRLIVLARGKVLADGTVEAVMAVDDDWIRDYFSVRRMA